MIRAEVSRLLIENISDPAITGVNITDVQLTKDLKRARIFYALRGEQTPATQKLTNDGFNRAKTFLRKQLGENLKMRYTPELIFQRDDHNESVMRLENLFDSLHAPAEVPTEE